MNKLSPPIHYTKFNTKPFFFSEIHFQQNTELSFKENYHMLFLVLKFQS